MTIEKKLLVLQEIITKHSPLLIAYSGGVDSATLAVITRETIGPENMHCILVDGPELPRRGLEEALSTAKAFDLPLEVVTGESFSEDLKKQNPHDRCRHCKLGTFRILSEAASRHSCTTIADGANASDLGEHRPGISAFSSCGVIHPFILASITKGELREIARMKKLPFWDKPSSACLYSRIPYGDEITDTKLMMIEHAENILTTHGFIQVRVRHHGNIARIEILPDEFTKLVPVAKQIEEEIRKLGFSYVTLDLRGYRSGSMDEVLSDELLT
jgi:uncharacterized protein